MTIEEPIICGVDGSSASRRAAITARSLASALRRRLVLVHVLPPRPAMSLAAVPVGGRPVTTADMAELDQLESDAAFRSVADVLGGAEDERIVERGHVPNRLSAVADAYDARLIVAGTRGMGAARSALLGSVSQELAASASRPVVVVPPADDASTTALGPGPVVCGIDGSDGSRAAAAVATRLADDLDAALTLVAVRTPRAIGDGLAVTPLEMPVIEQLERLAILGDPAEQLARAAADRKAALLVVGSRGRGSVRAALLGSVSAELTRRASWPDRRRASGCGRRRTGALTRPACCVTHSCIRPPRQGSSRTPWPAGWNSPLELPWPGCTMDAALAVAPAGLKAHRAPAMPVVVLNRRSVASAPSGASVVCGIKDDDDPACAAIAGALADALGVRLILVHAAPYRALTPALAALPGTPVAVPVGGFGDPAAGREIIDRVAAAAGLAQPEPAQIRMLRGAPGRTIVATGRRERAALVVVSASRRGGLWQLLRGSTASYLIRRCACPVVVCRRDPATAMRLREALALAGDGRTQADRAGG